MQRVILPAPGLIEVDVVNDGPDPITIAQVLVDDAYWQFTMEPAGDRSSGWNRRRSPSPTRGSQGEAHAIALVSSTGVLFEAEVPVAIESPAAGSGEFRPLRAGRALRRHRAGRARPALVPVPAAARAAAG